MRSQKRASPEEIAAIVVRLELRKQIKPLDDFQRKELIEQLYDLNQDAETIQRRADSVNLKETYGTIAFQYWLDPILTLEKPKVERGWLCECGDTHPLWASCPEQAADPEVVESILAETKAELKKKL